MKNYIQTFFEKTKKRNIATRENSRLNLVVSILSSLFCTLIYQAMIDIVRTGSITRGLEYVWLRRYPFMFGWFVMFAFFLIILFVTARPYIANLVSGVVSFLLAYVNLYDLLYRNSYLLPKDLTQWKEAINISGAFNLLITKELVLFVLLIVFSTVILFPFRLPFTKSWKSTTARILVSVLCAAFIPFYTATVLGNSEKMIERGLNYPFLVPSHFYYSNTFLTAFLYYTTLANPKKPSAYSKNNVNEIAAEIQGQTGKQPDVITILLESFSDINNLPGTTYSEDIFENYNRLANEGISGNSISQSYGGGTCNAEFSVLTGFSMSSLPLNTNAYLEYVNQSTFSLPKYYAQSGYDTLAIHPYTTGFYRRDFVYDNFMIDEFFGEDSFEETASPVGYVSDEAFANFLIEKYAEKAKSDAPVFIQGVTMQAHGPYDTGKYNGDMVTATSGFDDEEWDSMLSYYASCMRDTDKMLGQLTDYFNTVDREVILIFYGDHQSPLLKENGDNLFYASHESSGYSADELWMKNHEVPYLIWSNFKQDAKVGPVIEHAFLMPLAMQEYGMQTPGWFNWLAQAQPQTISEVGGHYIDSSGNFVTPTDAQLAIRAKLQLIQYDSMFGKKYAGAAMYG